MVDYWVLEKPSGEKRYLSLSWRGYCPIGYACYVESVEGPPPFPAPTEPPWGEPSSLSELPHKDELSFEKMLIVVGIVKLAQTPKGLEVIKTLGKEFIKGISDTLHALAQASSANQIAAWANPYLISLILERFGCVDSRRMMEYRIGLDILAGADVAEDVTETVLKVIPWYKATKVGEFPSQIVFSAREAGIEVPETITWEELRKLSAKTLLPRAPKKKKGS